MFYGSGDMLGRTVKVLPPDGLKGWNVGLVVAHDMEKKTINVRVFNHLDPSLDMVVVMKDFGYAGPDEWRWVEVVV